MQLNFLAIVVASVLQFIVGAIWYTFIFGKLWGKMHSFDKISPEEQKKMMAGMGKFYIIQFLVTILTTFVLALFSASFPNEWHVFGIAGFAWLGFILPTQISAVIFGGTEPKWIIKKILVSSGAALACMMVAAATLKMM